MAKTKGQNYMHGAAILTVGVVIMKILGFIYKIPLGNILGDEGFSMFTSAYNIYYVFFTLATAGLPVALWDERRTTITAAGILSDNGVFGQKRKDRLDSVSAAVILEGYLAWRKNHPED